MLAQGPLPGSPAPPARGRGLAAPTVAARLLPAHLLPLRPGRQSSQRPPCCCGDGACLPLSAVVSPGDKDRVPRHSLEGRAGQMPPPAVLRPGGHCLGLGTGGRVCTAAAGPALATPPGPLPGPPWPGLPGPPTSTLSCCPRNRVVLVTWCVADPGPKPAQWGGHVDGGDLETPRQRLPEADRPELSQPETRCHIPPMGQAP